MAAVQQENYALQSSVNPWSGMWELSRVIKQAGWSKLASSDGTNKEVSATASADKWGGNATPTADAYPSALDAVAAWGVYQGPTVIQLSFTSAITKGPNSQDFIVGEPVTQATSGATGQWNGYDYDAVNGAHAVIFPRTGSFDATHIVTGAWSGATMTPTALKTWITEMMIQKSTTLLSGAIAMQCVCNETENASRFSVLAGSAGCTASVAPGGGGTGNAFPTAGTWMMRGSNAGAYSFSNWFNAVSGLGKAQIAAANCTPGAGLSADGSWFISVGDTAAGDRMQPMGFFRCDYGEPADVNPFITFACANASGRTSAGVGGWTSAASAPLVSLGSTQIYRGWRRRGFASGDAYASFIYLNETDGASNIWGNNYVNPARIACSYATTPPLLRGELRLMSQDNTAKMYKGRVRHLDFAQFGAAFDVIDGKTRMALNTGVNGTLATLYCDLFDGVTVPTQT